MNRINKSDFKEGKAKKETTDLTKGNPMKQIFLFALPLVFGTLFQQLYSFVDTIIIGRCLGETALAAVGVTYSLSFLVLGFIQGCTVGFGVPVSQSFGAGEQQEVHRYIWNGIWLCVGISIVFTIVTVLLTVPLLTLIQTPDDILLLAARYIRIIFLGIPLTVLYNFSSSILRALGDSQRPFYHLLLSSGLNIVLDILFVAILPFGVVGAAAATIISQGISGVLNVYSLVAKTAYFRYIKEETKFSQKHAKRLCVIGLPMGFEYSVSAIGAVIMQYAINSLGSAAIAGQTAGEKIRQMFTLPMESVGMAMATYAAQNYGAKRMDRIKKGIRDGLCIQYLYCIASFIVIFFGKNVFVGFVLGETQSETAKYAVEYLSRISTLFCLHGTLMILRNTLQGMGHSVQAIISGFGELLGRSIGAWLSVGIGLGFLAICYSNPLAWGISLTYCAVMLAWHLSRASSKESKK